MSPLNLNQIENNRQQSFKIAVTMAVLIPVPCVLTVLQYPGCRYSDHNGHEHDRNEMDDPITLINDDTLKTYALAGQSGTKMIRKSPLPFRVCFANV